MDELKQPKTICARCGHCVIESTNNYTGRGAFVCLCHAKYVIDPVTGKHRRTTPTVQCCNKNKSGDCSDYDKRLEGDPIIGDPILKEF